MSVLYSLLAGLEGTTENSASPRNTGFGLAFLGGTVGWNEVRLAGCTHIYMLSAQSGMVSEKVA